MTTPQPEPPAPTPSATTATTPRAGCASCGKPDAVLTVTVAADLSHTGEAYQRPFGIDACIAPIVAALNAAGIATRQSCCGHGAEAGRIDLADGRTLTITGA